METRGDASESDAINNARLQARSAVLSGDCIAMDYNGIHYQ